MQDKKEQRGDLVAGRGPVLEALKNGRDADTLFVAKGKTQGPVSRIIALCREAGVPIKDVSPEKLEHLCPGVNHQGVVLSVPAHAYAEIDDIFQAAQEQDKPPFIIVCDELEDPHNLGAVIRTAEAAGAHGVIVPKRRAASLTFAVGKAAAGALEYVPVARVTNIAAAVDELKARGVWIYGADMAGRLWCDTDFSGPVGLVIGSEGRGISRLVREKCDFLVALPMLGKLGSLNASVAGGILMYEVARARLKGPRRPE